MATFTGTTLNDVLQGGTAADVIDGGAGNDRINGGAGDDLIYGGLGNDTLTGDAGNDTLYGGDGNDGFFGGGNNDSIFGEAGDDVMYGDGGDDFLAGGEGNDKLYGGTGNDTLNGGQGANILDGGAGFDTLVFEVSAATLTDAMLNDLIALRDWIGQRTAAAGSATALAAQTTGASLTLAALSATISTVEAFKVIVDGVETPLDALLNQAPVAAASVSAATNEDSVISGSIGATDANGDVLSYTVTSGPAHGALTVDAVTGAYSYSPFANFNGADAFSVLVSDGQGGTAVQTVSLTVNSVNDAPVVAASAVSLTANEDTAVTGTVSATDIDGDTLSYAVAQGPAHGTLTLNTATGAYTYTPAANTNGGDTFKVTVSDGNGGTATQDVTVAIAAVNDAPVVAASAVSLTANEDTAVTGTVSATDIDGDTLSYAVTQGPAHGTLTLNAATGAYTYTPAANTNGGDTFKVTVSDGTGGTATQDVTVAIAAVNDAPVVAASAVSLTANEDTTVAGTVSATDIDGDMLSYSVAQGPAHGTLTLNAATGAYTYTPAANTNGGDTFKVTVSDGTGGTATQDVTVAIAAVNDAPVVAASAVSLTANEDTAVTGTVSATDIDGDALTYSVSAVAQHGAVSINAATGAYTYTPVPNYSGGDFFDVLVRDASGATATQRVNVAIGAAADAPTLSVVSSTITPTGAMAGILGTGLFGSNATGTVIVALQISSALTDVDGSESLSIRISNVPAGGVLSGGVKNTDGSWTLTAADLAGLTLTATVANDFTLAVTATSTESAGGSASQSASILVDLQAASASNGGTVFNDTINGTSSNNRLSGGNGNDTINGGAGNDWISGDNGNDQLFGGAGNDVLLGGSGNDTFYSDTGNDVFNGGAGTDTLTFASSASSIVVDLARKVIYGSSTGVDAIADYSIETYIGSAFADTFIGSSGLDTIIGGGGNDAFRSSAGADRFTGGSGDDTFIWKPADVGGSNGVDRITDFDEGDDILDLSGLVSYTGGSLSDYVRFTESSDDTTVAVRINGSFVNVAVLEDWDDASASQMFSNGHLLLV